MNFSNLLNACGEYPDNIIPLNISEKTKRGYITINLSKLERYVNKWLKEHNITNKIKFNIKHGKLKIFLIDENVEPVNIGYILFGYDTRDVSNVWNSVRIPFSMCFYQSYTNGNDYFTIRRLVFEEKENLFPAFYESNYIEISSVITTIIIDPKFLYEENGALKGEKK